MCKQCQSPIETSVRLSCDHIVCLNCVKEMNITKNRKCAVCKREWNEDNIPTPVAENW